MSSTVQFFRIRPNLLPENRPSTSPPRSRARMRCATSRNHRVRDVEAEGIVDARQMIDADQHEGEGGAEARGFLDGLGQRRDQMGAIEFAGQRIVARQFQQLLVAGVAFVVDADNAMGARRPAVGAGEPAAGFLDPEHRRRGRGRARRIRSGRARRRRRAPAANGRARPTRIERAGSISLENSAPLASASAGISGKTEVSMIAPDHRVGGDVPDEGGLAERSEDGRSLRKQRMSRAPRFGTLPGDSLPKDSACFAPDQRVFRKVGTGSRSDTCES